MFAKYVVVNINGVPTPIIVPPSDVNWDRPIMNRDGVSVKSVLGAGELNWTTGPNPSVTCSGSGVFIDMRSKDFEGRIHVESRGDVDAALFRELLSKPIGYVILRLDRNIRPMFVPLGDTHDRAVLRYQVYPKKCVIGAGMVDFGFDTGSPECSGHGVFDNYNHPFTNESYAWSKHSQGAVDLATLEEHFKQ